MQTRDRTVSIININPDVQFPNRRFFFFINQERSFTFNTIQICPCTIFRRKRPRTESNIESTLFSKHHTLFKPFLFHMHTREMELYFSIHIVYRIQIFIFFATLTLVTHSFAGMPATFQIQLYKNMAKGSKKILFTFKDRPMRDTSLSTRKSQ